MKPRVRCKTYRVWEAMMHRCHSTGFLEKNPSYSNVSVCREWLDFEVFKAWYQEQPHSGLVGYALDKDILGDGTIYSPQACSLVPQYINNAVLTTKSGKVSSLPLGVSFSRNKYRASFNRKHIGSFNSPEEAHACYREAKVAYVRGIGKSVHLRASVDNRVLDKLKEYIL